jgi:hypothetical protein
MNLTRPPEAHGLAEERQSLDVLLRLISPALLEGQREVIENQ